MNSSLVKYISKTAKNPQKETYELQTFLEITNVPQNLLSEEQM
jgi:hypothetical protein